MRRIGIVGIVLIVVTGGLWAGFVGLAAATNALCVTGCTPPALVNTQGGPGGIEFSVQFAAPNGVPATVANWQNGLSTPISFYIQTVTHQQGSCSQNPGWDAGAGTQPAFAIVEILQGGTPTSFTPLNVNLGAGITGASWASSASGRSFVVSWNQSVTTSQWCFGSTGAYGTSPRTAWEPVSFQIRGPVLDYSVLQVQFFTTGVYCKSGGFGSTVPACNPAGANLNFASYWPLSLCGTTGSSMSTCPIGQEYIRNGGGSMAWNGQTVYNGQTFTVPTTTYYDGGSGFSAQFLYPVERGSGLIAQVPVPDSQTNYPVKFTVPANASSNSTSPDANKFQIVLYGALSQEDYVVQPIDVSPEFAPPPANVTLVDNSGNAVLHVGDSATLTAHASGIPKFSEAIAQITIWAWYVTPNTSAISLPTASSGAWVTSGGQTGLECGSNSGCDFSGGPNGSATATYTFTVTQPFSIQVQVESTTNTSQTSAAAFLATYYVQPPTCGPGPNCNSYPPPPTSEWGMLGPILLVAALASTGVLVAYFLPRTVRVTARVLTAVAIGAPALLLYVLGFLQPLFMPGGGLA